MFSVRGRTIDSNGLDNDPFCNLWNPHSTHLLKIVQFSYSNVNPWLAVGGIKLRRSTARGTQTSTVTPDIDNHHKRAAAPFSGAVLDLDWSVNPTIDTSDLGFGWIFPPSMSGSGIIYPIPGGIVVPPGTGLAGVANEAVHVQEGDVTFTWLEDW